MQFHHEKEVDLCQNGSPDQGNAQLAMMTG
jgi:hypothetical protein